MKTKQRAKIWLKLRHVDDKKTPTQLDIFVLLKNKTYLISQQKRSEIEKEIKKTTERLIYPKICNLTKDEPECN